MMKLTNDEFIKRCKFVHGDRYDYSNTVYKNKRTKVSIICQEHGQFETYPFVHLRGSNCSLCINNNIKYTKLSFIDMSYKVHGKKYDYSSVEYYRNSDKIKIICPVHGAFEQTPNSHLSGNGCPICAGTKKLTLDEFINKSNIIHNHKYDYGLVNYKNNRIKVEIMCPIHGIFNQKPINHIIQKQGCPICAGTKKLTLDEFINKSNIIHNHKYDYGLVNYKNNRIKVEIICPIHGKFKQSPNSHLNGKGCPICNESKGEKIIRTFLEKNNIMFVSQKKFKNCKHKRLLSFDFYLPQFNMCVEFDGIYHMSQMKFIDDNRFNESKIRDNIKNEYCLNNKIKLIRIGITEFNVITNILKKELNLNG